MRRVSKIIFIAAVIFIMIWVCILIFQRDTQLYFVNRHYRDILDAVILLGLPISILLTLFGIIDKNDNKGIVIIKTVAAMVVAVVVMFFLFINILTGMCTLTYQGTLFENKQDLDQKIVLQQFGCGATDSTTPTVTTYGSTPFTPLLVKLTPIDTDRIDMSQWRRVPTKGK